ncbi:prolyl aminopeptidase [Paraneptunicella aestuarii]|uniref:prolyl aminopeptidase n=1 Tax=Paraneptunicella aestuarii TaxID=2831148 RepID=UPI001E4F001B|nr:prolyl aminopeptidase [Paraneptunicella aestuarii]UAA38624.1 prolyl aminopeptidase [Paraneptunicella aestuarii]
MTDHFIPVSDTHTIRVIEVTHPANDQSGPYVAFMHGGPGSGVNLEHIDYIDFSYFRVLLIDQRGAGKSTPLGELRENNLQLLIDDVECVREYFDIDCWYITAGSWGSTLALAYAIKYPQRVQGMILRGVFLGREQDTQWLYRADGASRFYPEQWREFSLHREWNDSKELLHTYSSDLANQDVETRLNAAYRWICWASVSMAIPSAYNELTMQDKRSLHAKASIMCHFLSNKCFLPTSNYILENIAAIQTIPLWIVHGREDVICPPDIAWTLAQAHGSAHLQYLDNVGHSPSEAKTRSALMNIFNELKEAMEA